MKERNVNCCHLRNMKFCIHIDGTTLIDRMNELVPESENELRAAQANQIKLPKTWTNDRKSPKAKYLPRKASPGASNAYYFPLYAIYVVIYLSVHLSF